MSPIPSTGRNLNEPARGFTACQGGFLAEAEGVESRARTATLTTPRNGEDALSVCRISISHFEW